MSVIVKGMEMPKNCCDCPLFKANKSAQLFCKGFRTSFDRSDYDLLPHERMRWCPIIEAPEWISVEARLPEKGVWVLCKCRAGIYEVLRWTGNSWHHDHRHDYMKGFVTHWMPMPEPPEECE